MTEPILDQVLTRIAAFEVEVKELLGGYEGSSARVITLEQSYNHLDQLSIDQDELFREALRAIEHGLYRAAHVLAWAGFIDFLHNYLWDNYETDLGRERPLWKLGSAEDFRDQNDFSVIETGRVISAYTKTPMKALHGLLNKRNECGHPSDYYPDLNGALGYLSDLFKRISFLQKKVGT